MEVNSLKFQTFLAKMHQIENQLVRTNEGIWFFLFAEKSVSYSNGLEEMKEYEYHFAVKLQLEIYQFIEWIDLEFS